MGAALGQGVSCRALRHLAPRPVQPSYTCPCSCALPRALRPAHPPHRAQSSRAAHQEALAREEEARRAAERLVAEERAQRQRMLSAAASGNLPLLAAAGGAVGTPGGAGAAAGAAASPGLSPGEAAGAAGLSATELYSRYVEMHERYRAERLKVRQQEIVMEELCAEVEKRAALVQEQQVHARAFVGWSGCQLGCCCCCWAGSPPPPNAPQ